MLGAQYPPRPIGKIDKIRDCLLLLMLSLLTSWCESTASAASPAEATATWGTTAASEATASGSTTATGAAKASATTATAASWGATWLETLLVQRFLPLWHGWARHEEVSWTKLIRVSIELKLINQSL